MRSSVQRQQARVSSFAGSLLLGATLLSPVSLWAAVSAHLDRDVIHQGDSVNLTIESDRAGQTTAPDWTPLQQDFVVLATQRGSLTQIINDRRNDKITWSAELEPRKSGSLEVPSINVGAETTPALALRVAPPPPAASAAAGDPVFITVSVAPEDDAVRVQQQLHYKVRLYSKHPIVDGVLSDPQSVDAVVEQLGEDRKGSARVGGHTFQVIERDYAIFPEKSGALEIPPGEVSRSRGRPKPAAVDERSLSAYGLDDERLLSRAILRSVFSAQSAGRKPVRAWWYQGPCT